MLKLQDIFCILTKYFIFHLFPVEPFLIDSEAAVSIWVNSEFSPVHCLE